MRNGVAEQKLDPDLKKKNSNFRSDLVFFEEKNLPNRCGMGVWRLTCPNLIRTMHQMV